MKLIPYGNQFIDKGDISQLSDILKKDKITTGPVVEAFEKKINNYLKSKYSLVCNSGTSAIFLALKSIGIKKGDCIIMPSINFIASYNVSKFFNAKVYLSDVNEKTGLTTPDKIIECCKKFKIKKIKAIITMYNGGYPENADKFFELKKKYNCKIIEDACHAFGAKYQFKNKTYKIGSCKHSDICTFSFHPLKTITTGEGGAITTNSKKLYNKMLLSRSHGIERKNNHHWKYEVNNYGLNLRLTDFQSALGISQLNKINKFLLKRKKIANIYKKNLDKIKQIEILSQDRKYISSNHLFLIHLKNFTLKKKDKFIKFMLKKKIILQYHYIPVYRFKIFKDKAIKKYSEIYYKNTISLPIYYSLTFKKQKYIIDKIKMFFK